MTVEVQYINVAVLAEPDGTASLVLQLTGEVLHSVVLQHGYQTPAHALSALVDCLTFQPPDLTSYDDALAQVSALLDRATAIEEAITQLGERLNAVEDRIEAAAPTPPPRQGLLPNRNRPGPTVPVQAPNPPIRQAQPRRIMSAGHGAGGKVTGGSPLEITGGVGRPGQLNPTGPGTDQGDDGTGDG